MFIKKETAELLLIRIFKGQRLLKTKKTKKQKNVILPFVMLDFVFTKRVFYSEKASEVLEA